MQSLLENIDTLIDAIERDEPNPEIGRILSRDEILNVHYGFVQSMLLL
jgi:hypothetical protein